MASASLTRDQISSILGDSWDRTSIVRYVQPDPTGSGNYILAYTASDVAHDFPDPADGQGQSLAKLLAMATTIPASPTPISIPTVTPILTTAVSAINSPSTPNTSTANTTSTIINTTTPTASISTIADAPSLVSSATESLMSSAVSISLSPTSSTPATASTVAMSNNQNVDIYGEINTSLAQTKDSIADLMKIKNPVSWLMQVKKIRDDIALTLEDLADNLNSQFEMQDQRTEMGFLSDLGFGDVLKTPESTKYFIESRYFDPEVYFRLYGAIDDDFHSFARSLFGQGRIDTNTLRQNDRFVKYSSFLDIYDQIAQVNRSAEFTRQSLQSAAPKNTAKTFASMRAFMEVVLDRDDADDIVPSIYACFPVNESQIKYLNFGKNLALYTSIDADRLTDREYEIIDSGRKLRAKIDAIVRSYHPDESFLINVSRLIHGEVSVDSEFDRACWRRHISSEVQTEYYHDAVSSRLITNQIREKVHEENWLEQRLNYRVRLRSQPSKRALSSMMDQYNQFRRIILQIQDSVFSDFTKPFVYEFLAERLSLNERSYKYLKYFLLFILPKSYLEYEKIYTFFYEYEAFKSGKKLRFFFFVAVLQILMIAAIGWYYSAIFALGIVVFYIGAYIKRVTFTLDRPILRLHLGFQTLGILIIAGYTLLLLNSNGYIVVDPKLSIVSRPEIRQVIYYTLQDVPYADINATGQKMAADVFASIHSGSGMMNTSPNNR